MADVKISALPASTTPLAGTEVLPIVQSGTTVKTSVSSLIPAALTGIQSIAGTNTTTSEEADALILYGSNNAGDGYAGSVDIEGGENTGTGGGGSISITGGVATEGNGGGVEIRGGYSETGSGGTVSIASGSTDVGVEGRIELIINNTLQVSLSDSDLDIGTPTIFQGLTDGDIPLVRIRQIGTGPALFIEDVTDPTTSPTVFHASGGVSIGNEIDVGSGNLYAAGNLAGNIVTAVTAVTTPSFKAFASGGAVLESENGTDCMTFGVGNGANVNIKGELTLVNAGASGDPKLSIATNDAADAIVVVPSVIGSATAGTLIIDVGDANVAAWTFSGGDLFPSQGATAMTNGFAFIPGANGAPSGTPTTTNAGVFPMYVDSTFGSERLYVYVNGSWTYTTLTTPA